jgi:hypothetical protein
MVDFPMHAISILLYLPLCSKYKTLHILPFVDTALILVFANDMSQKESGLKLGILADKIKGLRNFGKFK